MGLARGQRESEDTVASHASALKAHRQNIVHRERNRQLRSKLRGSLRAIRALIDEDDFGKARTELKGTISLIDRMVTKGVIHKNAAARYKSRLQKRVSAAPAK
jgi:small subunit ribosomal protein S20